MRAISCLALVSITACATADDLPAADTGVLATPDARRSSDASRPADATSPSDGHSSHPDGALPDAGVVDAAWPALGAGSDSFDATVVDLLTDNPTAWSILHPERAAAVRMTNGRLDIVSLRSEDVGAHNGWYQDDYGPMVYQHVTGNFAVAARWRVVDEMGQTTAPVGNFSAGGFVVRDPNGTHSNNENWVMYNFGTNLNAYQREVKKTVGSVSGLYLNPQSLAEHTLLVCRVAARFYFYFWDAGAGQWLPERFEPGVTIPYVNSIPEVDTSGATQLFFNDVLPATVQVGVMSHQWSYNGGNARTLSSYDWVAFAATPPASVADCTQGFASLGY